jgi:2-keto-4-pentenoate hydratase/2-oxohepta-3-ene-1,7-dioic acid hydratase in catechol pathway
MPHVLLGEKKVRVGTVYCIGKNYDDHAKEMSVMLGSDLRKPDVPLVFAKPATAIIHSGEKIKMPTANGKALSSDMHHETEMVLLIKHDAHSLPESAAGTVIAGIGVGLDMTLRDVQTEAKKAGSPWLVSKGFRTSAVVSGFYETSDLERIQSLHLELKKNSAVVQSGETSEMIFSAAKIIAYLSEVFGLLEGDLIFTGTPAGVAAVKHRDILEAKLFSNDGEGRETRYAELRAEVDF